MQASKEPDSKHDVRSPVPDSIYSAGKAPKDVIGSLSGTNVTIVGTDFQILKPASNVTQKDLNHKAKWSYERSPSKNIYYYTEMLKEGRWPFAVSETKAKALANIKARMATICIYPRNNYDSKIATNEWDMCVDFQRFQALQF